MVDNEQKSDVNKKNTRKQTNNGVLQRYMVPFHVIEMPAAVAVSAAVATAGAYVTQRLIR